VRAADWNIEMCFFLTFPLLFIGLVLGLVSVPAGDIDFHFKACHNDCMKRGDIYAVRI
jgi:hypothetical protein